MTEANSGFGETEFRHALRDLVVVAFAELTSERVIPPSRFHPWIRVGRDYYGPALMALPEFKTCEAILESRYPNRFDKPHTRRHPEFANHNLLHFIEACVRRCWDDDDYSAHSDAVADSISGLTAVLDADLIELKVVRAVSHIQTTTGAAITIDGIEVVPERDRQDFDFFMSECRARVPGAGSSFNRERPAIFAHPHAVLATTETVALSEPDWFGTVGTAQRRIDRFMLLLRLLTGTTAKSHFDVAGTGSLVGPMTPQITHYHAQALPPMVRRSATVDEKLGRAVIQLGAMIDGLQVKREGMATASFDVALDRFTASFASDNLTTVVDLATALEAVFVDSSDGMGASRLDFNTDLRRC